MLGRLFELRDEVITFLAQQKQNELSAEFKKPWNQVILAYLSDFFDTLNNLNLRLQGADSNIVTHRDAIKIKVVSVSEEVCFEDVFEGPLLKNLIIDHLKNLKEEFSRYFPNLSEELYKLSTDPFNMDIQLLPEELQEEGIEIKNDSAARYDFDKMDKPSFWLNTQTNLENPEDEEPNEVDNDEVAADLEETDRVEQVERAETMKRKKIR
ncbi:protein FAM200B-like [Leptinotarsa decemlineata]|uniref:protein FAM200B-like n=1 Tax=Leptinotarsa decemlineata TaxID=7539 RepID=UPI003D306DA3